MSAVRSIIRACLPRNDYNIVSFSGPVDYICLLAQIGYKIYYWDNKWPSSFLSKPDNVVLLDKPEIPISLDIDCVLAHERIGSFIQATKLSRFWHVPLITIHHSGPHALRSSSQWPQIQNTAQHNSIYLTSEIREAWEGIGGILQGGIHSPTINLNKTDGIVCPYPENQKEQQVLQQIEALGLRLVVAQNLTWSKLIEMLNEYRYFLNIRPPFLHMSMLQAIACGSVVISLDYPEVHDILKNIGILFTKPQQIPELMKRPMDVEKAIAFRETRHCLPIRDAWMNLLEEVTEQPYV